MYRLASAFLLIAATPLAAQPVNPQIDYPGYQRLARAVRPHRQTHLVDFATFSAMARRPNVLILDARSESAFREGHIAGAVNLPLPDFTPESVRRVIGRRDRTILIYCNNNFSNNVRPVMTKVGAARAEHPDLHPALRPRLSQRLRAERGDRFQRAERALGRGAASGVGRLI